MTKKGQKFNKYELELIKELLESKSWLEVEITKLKIKISGYPDSNISHDEYFNKKKTN